MTVVTLVGHQRWRQSPQEAEEGCVAGKAEGSREQQEGVLFKEIWGSGGSERSNYEQILSCKTLFLKRPMTTVAGTGLFRMRGYEHRLCNQDEVDSDSYHDSLGLCDLRQITETLRSSVF